ncbi:rhodanese-like domain-containing protein [uncultured Maritimibacter sp.]|jgi:rhodanese-related sulfurtransferase|uniref:rhodanese-like domain-containing protein n=1 Tax=uncultured Maritimibacter sp. TaxID=991866 RepID=UPI002627FBD3|nr:rhodanese-like domain-containing protein [uncultured Maritimibacter sp.]
MFGLLGGRAAKSGVSPQEAVAKAAAGEITVVDVRDAGELAASGKAKGAVHIPLAVIRMQGDPKSPDFNPALSLDKPVAVYCASGGRSSMAAQVLAGYGFDVTNIGGLGHWQMAGGEIVRA